MTDKVNTVPALATIVNGGRAIVNFDAGYRGQGSAGQNRRERERLLSEGSVLNFHDGLSDEGAFVIVLPDGARVEHAGGVALVVTTEAQEQATVASRLGAQLAKQWGEIDADFERAFIARSGERDFADVILGLTEERPAVEGLRSEFMFGFGGVLKPFHFLGGHPSVRRRQSQQTKQDSDQPGTGEEIHDG